ncbi:Annexin [Aspergillus steynii IBT 23096]|uniref:Annexin n=1 Tax=Aspergillus steynii IBT 23096 TaxID=1392250 RepID=A0A2I2GSL9_9EURO|nr:Annexin [Aspergillus steynii IBT 23096]PLB55868.1 Annexin [Aspergillus steynii IBT 23096]
MHQGPPHGGPHGAPPYPPYPQQGFQNPPYPNGGGHPQQFGYPPGPPQQGHPPHGGSPYPPYPSSQGGHGFPPGPPQGPPQGHHPGYPHGAPPMSGAHGQHPYPSPSFPSQAQFPSQPAIPSLGYTPGQVAPGEFRPQADALRKSMKGFGTDEKALINTISKLDPLQMAAVRKTYTEHIRRDLYKDVKSETSGYLRQGLLAVIDGPLAHDVACVREAVDGVGTKEWMLNDVLLGRSNADLHAIMSAYQRTYNRSLQKDVEGDLSFQTLGLFKTVLRCQRHEESMPLDPRMIEEEAKSIHSATAGRMTNNVEEVCGIFARSSDEELRAINQAYSQRYNTPLEKHIQKEFSGHMKDALMHILQGALDPAMRDAVALEDCMKGMGTKDEKLVVRAVRVHWNRAHLDQVRRAYQHKFQKALVDRVRGETSGDYQRLMVGLLE